MLLFKKYLFICLCQVIAVACRIQFPHQELNLGPLHWERSLSHWTTRAVPKPCAFILPLQQWRRLSHREVMSYDAGRIGTLAGWLQHAAPTQAPSPQLHMTNKDAESWHGGGSGKRTEQAALWPLWNSVSHMSSQEHIQTFSKGPSTSE